MFRYMICDQADENIYYKQCAALEKNIPGLRKGKELIDVDESKIQEYFLSDKRITVHNSIYLNDVHVKSEIELRQFFVIRWG